MPNKKKYEVETKFTYGWENVWMDDDDKLVFFKTKKDAQAELKDNVDSWNDDPNTTSKYSYDDYRIIYTDKKNRIWLILE